VNKAILRADVQQFINDHLNTDPAKIALGKSPFADVSPAELAEQIDSKKRCEKKLPTWFNTPGIYYPSKLAIEQTSSEIATIYNSGYVAGKNIVDLTGGFGVDSFAFAQLNFHNAERRRRVIHCELNAELSAIAKHNAGVLNVPNIEFLNIDGLDYIRETRQSIDAIFIDPSRRVKSQKVFFLKDCEPDVVTNQDLLNKAPQIVIKTSPLLDITSGLRELKNVKKVVVISIKNDVKELLWIVERGFTGDPQIECDMIFEDHSSSTSFYQHQEKLIMLPGYSDPLTYLYEPDAGILKAGMFKITAVQFGLSKLDKNTHLYTSNELNEQFPGKKFVVNKIMDYKVFSKSPDIKKANIISKNFPLTPAELKKKHKLEDGGDGFLFFCRVNGEQLKVIWARRA
jgi:16S rRNA G966 N2-methylase RsmD